MKKKSATMVAATLVLASLLPGCGAAEPQGDADTVDSQVQPLNNPADEIWDSGNQCTVSLPGGGTATTMHCCPNGYMMMGVHVGQNKFRCVRFSPDTPNARFLDTGTQRTVGGTTMHACPPGAVMVGLHVGLNRFACQRPANGLFQATEELDTSTQFQGVHVCEALEVNQGGVQLQPVQLAMTGLHVGLNRLACTNGP